jgi:serine/threonine protein kinase
MSSFRYKHEVVIKVLRNTKSGANSMNSLADEVPLPLSDQQKRNAESEIIMLNYVADPSVVCCYCYVPDPKNMMIVLEVAPYGSLWDLVRDRVTYPAIPVSLSMAWLSDMADAIKHIHSKGVIHKDIKCENMLVFTGLKAKLSDLVCPSGTLVGWGLLWLRAPEQAREPSWPPKYGWAPRRSLQVTCFPSPCRRCSC